MITLFKIAFLAFHKQIENKWANNVNFCLSAFYSKRPGKFVKLDTIIIGSILADNLTCLIRYQKKVQRAIHK